MSIIFLSRVHWNAWPIGTVTSQLTPPVMISFPAYKPSELATVRSWTSHGQIEAF